MFLNMLRISLVKWTVKFNTPYNYVQNMPYLQQHKYTVSCLKDIHMKISDVDELYIK